MIQRIWKISRVAIGIVLAVFIFASVKALTGANTETQPVPLAQFVRPSSVVYVLEPRTNARVTKVIDGDTFVIEGGESVRLLGIDAAEKGEPCYDVAKQELSNFISDKIVALEADREETDQYGRLLRYVFLGNMNLSVRLTEDGVAVARFFPANVKYKNEVTAAEAAAAENHVGCKWQSVEQ
jgi:endonuclease YncB( thermonuclease family)